MGSPARIDTRDITRIAVFAAIIAVLGLPGPVPVFGAIPITAQTLGVMLAGAVLGSWRGAAAVAIFEVLVLLGLPLLSGGYGGVGVFVGPSAGYLVGWIFGAFVIGAIVRADRKPTWWRTALGCLVGGIGVVYAFGIPIQSVVTRLPLAPTALSSVVFLPGDVLKVVVATLVTMALWRAYPQGFRRGAAATPHTATPQTATAQTATAQTTTAPVGAVPSDDAASSRAAVRRPE